MRWALWLNCRGLASLSARHCGCRARATRAASQTSPTVRSVRYKGPHARSIGRREGSSSEAEKLVAPRRVAITCEKQAAGRVRGQAGALDQPVYSRHK